MVKLSRRIVWKGFFEGDSGYIQASKRYPLATKLVGYDTAIMPLAPISKDNPLSKMVIDKVKDDDLIIFHQIPTVSPSEKGYFTVTEFNVCPHEWWISLSNAEIILTQSKFCKDVFSKIEGIDKNKIKVVNYPLPEYCKPEGGNVRHKFLPDNNTFVFGSCFEWVARKKPELMWQAFTEEFDKDENVMFINKMSIPQGFKDWMLRFNKFRLQDNRIKSVHGRFEDMGDFYRSLDCYISTSAGEGWGATLSEAMACGIPTIGSKHSGNLEFMNKYNSWLVDMDQWEYIGDDRTNALWMVHPYQRWRLPKVDSIRKQMRSVFENKDKKKVTEALKIRDKLSLESIGKQIHKAFAGIL